MNKKWLFLATLAIIMVGSASLYFTLKDKRIKSTNQTIKINKIKIYQVLDEGYTYVLDWIPRQDKLLAYLDGYVEIVDIYSGKREKVLKLNEREVNGYQPLCISPDGSKVVLKENDDVIIFDLRKRIKEKIFTDNFARTFSWSPDSKNIAYESNNDIYTYSLETKQITRLTFDRKYWYPHWAPIGELIAFRDYKNNGLWVIKINEIKKIKKLLSNDIYWYQWYPNGKMICFSKKGEDEHRLFLVNVGNKKITKFYNLDFPAEIDISPDGKQIVLTKQKISEYANDIITSDDIEDVDIYITNISMKKLVNITKTPREMEISPTWSPDGKKILAFKVKNYSDERPIPIVIKVCE